MSKNEPKRVVERRKTMNLVELDFYNRSQELLGAMAGAAMTYQQQNSSEPQADPPLLIKFRRGQAEAPAWFLIQAAEFDPEPLTVEKLRVRDVYAAERYVRALLDIMASEKWFDRRDETYHLTESGRAVMHMLLRRPAELFTPLEQNLPAQELHQLLTLLGQIVDSSLQSPYDWCLRHSRNRAKGTGSLVKLYEYLSDFNAFRDDCHMAAWQVHNLSGHTWEAFSFVMEGQAKTAADLFDTLHYRGHTQQEYAAALDELVKRGWLDSDYQPSPAGKAVREEAERLTNAYFYAPWSVLSDADIQTLDSLFIFLQTHFTS